MQEFLDYILDHYQRPRRRGRMEEADVVLKGGNPGCGDVVVIYLRRNSDGTLSVSFTGEGCAVSQACASIVCEEADGKTPEEIMDLNHTFLEERIGPDILRSRLRCATLALDTLKAAVSNLKTS
ncbi:MAG: iron-sulfur cluster assembly scaffold protein [Thermotogae bacterium]|nr:iron-sulfur cluster assembly scaffold protein [Thermotogota bacterium]